MQLVPPYTKGTGAGTGGGPTMSWTQLGHALRLLNLRQTEQELREVVGLSVRVKGS
jgi:hypothetical protein